MSVEPQREWFEKDYYKVLGVAENASDSAITKAYRKLAKKLHPDANPGNASAENKFKEAASAYDVLSDAEKRAAYDEVRRLGPMAAGFNRGGPGTEGTFDPRSFNFDLGDSGQAGRAGDLGDLLGGLFNRQGTRHGARRGDDLNADLRLGFSEAVSGTTTVVPVMGDGPCRTCDGRGTKPGTQPTPCDTCGGRGMVNENQGLFSFSRPCVSCQGRGGIIEDPCPTCAGRGLQTRRREVKARIPAGVTNGQRIKLKGRGAPGVNGGVPGDLYVRVHVSPHPLFERDGKNLTLTVPVTFAEAALGANIRVPTLNGTPVTIRIPPGTASGKRMRIPANDDTSGADQIVVIEVVVPQNPSDEQRAAIEALSEVSNENPRSHMEV